MAKTQGDWRSISNDRDKYSAYLCSREWAERREAVRERANGICERCRVLPMDACHHLSYANKYNEPLEDLQAICTPCHEFTHAKCDIDPVEHSNWLRFVAFSPCNHQSINLGDKSAIALTLIEICTNAAERAYSTGNEEVGEVWSEWAEFIGRGINDFFWYWWGSGCPEYPPPNIVKWSAQFFGCRVTSTKKKKSRKVSNWSYIPVPISLNTPLSNWEAAEDEESWT